MGPCCARHACVVFQVFHRCRQPVQGHEDPLHQPDHLAQLARRARGAHAQKRRGREGALDGRRSARGRRPASHLTSHPLQPRASNPRPPGACAASSSDAAEPPTRCRDARAPNASSAHGTSSTSRTADPRASSNTGYTHCHARRRTCGACCAHAHTRARGPAAQRDRDREAVLFPDSPPHQPHQATGCTPHPAAPTPTPASRSNSDRATRYTRQDDG